MWAGGMKKFGGLLKKHDKPRQERAPGRLVLKSPREIELMRAAGRIVRRVHEEVTRLIRPGVPTAELNRVAEEIIHAAGGTALFHGVQTTGTKFPFPAALCISINDEVVHGIPGARRLAEGDIVSIDCGVRLKGYCGDAATTHAVGPISPLARRLLDVTEGSLNMALEMMKPGVRWSEVAGAIQAMVEGAGFSVVREFVGHGVGMDMHEEPKVPNYTDDKQKKEDFILQPGLVIAVEPMVNTGGAAVACRDPSGWTQVTKDGGLSAHFEHTVAILENGITLLTDGN